MRKPIYQIFAVIVLLAMLLSACQPAAAPAAPAAPAPADTAAPAAPAAETHEPVTIKWAGWMQVEWGDETYNMILDSFKEKYPWITVEVVDMPYNDVLGKYQAAAATGEAFDVFATEVAWNVPLYNAGYLEDLGPWLEKDAEFDASLVRSTYDMQNDGKTTGVCMYLITFGLIYNVKMFEELDLEPPTNWDEFIAVAKEFKEKRPDMYAVALPWNGYQGVMSRTWNFLATNYGGKYLDEEGKPYLQNPAGIKSLEKWKELYEMKDIVVPNSLGNDTMVPREMYANEQVPMLFEGPFAAGVARLANPDLVSAYTPPWKNEDGTGGYQWICSGTSISSKSAHKEEAFLFLKHLMSDEVSQRMLTANQLPWATKYAMEQLKTSDDQVLNKLPLMAENDPAHNFNLPALPGGVQLNEVWKTHFQEAVSGVLPIEEALKKTSEEWQVFFDEAANP